MTEEDPLGPLDPDFAARFTRDIRRPPCQLYLVSPLDVGGAFPDRLARALDAGPVAAFQFRVKDVDQHEATRLGEPLRAICAERDVAFIVNDSIALAKRLGADGVHLGQEDASVASVRELAGDRLLVGVSTHDLAEARRALHEGADYVGVGAMFPTATKVRGTSGPEYLGAFLETTRETRPLPHLAIGGITPGNVSDLVAVGCRGVAVSGVVCASDDPAGVCRKLLESMGGL